MSKKQTLAILISLLVLLIITIIFNTLNVSKVVSSNDIIVITSILTIGIIVGLIYFVIKFIKKGTVNKIFESIVDWVTFFTLAIAFLLMLTNFVISTSRVSGTSMAPTLQDKDMLFVYYFNYEPKHNDVIIIISYDGTPLVKRAIALPGDTITFVKDGINDQFAVYVNDATEPVLDGNNEIYYVHGNYIRRSEVWNGSLIHTLGENAIFILGDNSENSDDSKQHGFYEMDNVIGKVVWPKNER